MVKNPTLSRVLFYWFFTIVFIEIPIVTNIVVHIHPKKIHAAVVILSPPFMKI